MSPTIATVATSQRRPSIVAAAAASSAAETSSVRCVPISGIAIERGHERPEQAADRRERVEPPRDLAGRRDLDDREADRERRDHPEQDDRRREQQQRPEERADHGARRHLVEPARRDVEDRRRDERDQRDEQRRCEDEPPEQLRRRVAVGDAARRASSRG